MKALCRALASLLVLSLCACVAPQTIVTQPTTARSQPTVVVTANNGAIFQQGTARMLFEEPVARRIGEILVVTIEENLSAVNKANSNTNRDGGLTLSGSGSLPYVPQLDKLFSADASLSANNKFSGKGETNSSNTFKGSIAVTVTDVFANGNLAIGGEKQIAINGYNTVLRFTGVVNPNDITAGNKISSTRVADARIEQLGQGAISDANTMGWMQRVFLSVWPF
ncbi:flagellar basal body L-ring protein FlgH [Chitinibacter bivalviorum]|uniref:Flagellar L-ring protein n=1 Tax=Chitinibacter bivalviorum TaxID=2739434 RepID=A0A7H9BL52_9NEIS|nr:flagellar basal body L-ring protein FlgH [Chitinibacter bivalviorum]QLG88134.1 flagellar basal body L-ring protein FlgH [Chitinibacter bivalviorum]